MRLVDERWFPLFDLGLAFFGGLLWYVAGGILTWQPLVFVMIPPLIRLGSGVSFFKRTPMDFPIILFGLTAVIAAWASYDPVRGWGKFYIIVGAIFIYYAVAKQSRRHIWGISGGIGGIGVLFSIYFMLTHDWLVWPTDIGALTALGVRLMQIRPSISTPALHPNIVGGIIAVTLPCLMVYTYAIWHKRQYRYFMFLLGMNGVALLGFLLTSSRAAWMATFFAFGLWALWELSSFMAEKVEHLSQRQIFGIGLLAGFLGLMLISAVLPNGLLTLLNRIPGADSSTSRIELMRQSLFLVGDYPFTGGGLAAFGAHYSAYIRVLPHFIFDYSHNLYLDVLLDQGWLGLVTLLWIFIESLSLLWGYQLSKGKQKREVVPEMGADEAHDVNESQRERPSQNFSHRRRKKRKQVKPLTSYPMRWMVFVSMLIMLLHGLVDDALYSGLGTPLLFVFPAMIMPITQYHAPKFRWSDVIPSRKFLGTVGVLLLFIVSALIFRRTFIANWYANQGVIEMSRVELLNWPMGEWHDGQNIEAFNSSKGQLNKSLQYDAENVTANYYLGLIAMLARDYETAVIHLETAQQQKPTHPGLVKSLGYTHVWLGNYNQASELLSQIPEAKSEMEVYTWWWRTQDRDDLAENALQMVSQLESE